MEPKISGFLESHWAYQFQKHSKKKINLTFSISNSSHMELLSAFVADLCVLWPSSPIEMLAIIWYHSCEDVKKYDSLLAVSWIPHGINFFSPSVFTAIHCDWQLYLLFGKNIWFDIEPAIKMVINHLTHIWKKLPAILWLFATIFTCDNCLQLAKFVPCGQSWSAWQTFSFFLFAHCMRNLISQYS